MRHEFRNVLIGDGVEERPGQDGVTVGGGVEMRGGAPMTS
jgi:hypothetical protein